MRKALKYFVRLIALVLVGMLAVVASVAIKNMFDENRKLFSDNMDRKEKKAKR